MKIQPGERICVVPKLSGVGGMVSFREKLLTGLTARGIAICQDLDDKPYQAVLVVGGTRQLGKLWRARREGVRVVQRLDGMNWLHHRFKTGVRHFLRAEYGNWLLRYIRARLADRIVYQSRFAHEWWDQTSGQLPKPVTVIYNGVDLQIFSPGEVTSNPSHQIKVLLVEGSLMGGYELGLEHAFHFAAGLARQSPIAYSNREFVELQIVGRVPGDIQKRWNGWATSQVNLKILWTGLVPHAEIPAMDRSADMLFSSDLNAACPNSVIEALACGTPVVSFDTGALPELVPAEAGRIAAYGGNPWILDPPDLQALVLAGVEVIQEGESLRKGARAQAETNFGLDDMVARYQEVLLVD